MARQQAPPATFRGFRRPTYTIVPDELFDELLVELSGAELKTLLYIIRRTFGFKKEADSISLSQLLHGIRTRDGQILDRGTGLSKPTLLQALRSLESKQVIESERQQRPDGGDRPTLYRLKFAEDEGVKKGDPPVVKNHDHGGGQEISPRGWSRKMTTQESVKQQTDGQEEIDRSIIRKARRPESDAPGPLDRTPVPTYQEERASILECIEDFAREFSDRASLKASTTRAFNLFVGCGLPLETFMDALYEARRITKEHSASIRAERGDDGRSWAPRPKMPYFFAVLEQLVGSGTGGQPS